MNIKRFLSMLLILVTLLTVVPVAAFAESLTLKTVGTSALPADEIEVEESFAAPTTGAARLNKTKATVFKGGSLQLKKLGTSRSATWSSSNKKIATVSSSGKVRGKGYGTCTITCKLSNGTKLKCKITVKRKLTHSVSGPYYNYGQKYYKVKLNNKMSTKTVKDASFNVRCYNSAGKLIAATSSPIHMESGARIYPKSSWIGNLSVPNDTTRVIVGLVKVYYTDGTTWVP